MPNRHKTMLLEFCYPRNRVRMSPGFCFVLSDNDGVITNYEDTRCTNFINNSCQMSYDEANEMYKYPACLKINPSNSCYTSDPECPSVPDDAFDSTRASETTTIDILGNSQTTNSSTENQGHPTKEDFTTVIIIVIVLIVVIGCIVAAGIIYQFCYKKSSALTFGFTGSSPQMGEVVFFQGDGHFYNIPRKMIGNVEILDCGCSIKLVCIAETTLTNQLTSVEWKKDGTVLQMDGSKYSGGDEREPSLVIHNVSVEDAGNYQCEIAYTDETSNSKAFEIDLPAVEFIGKEVRGSNLVLKCKVSKSCVKLSIHWKRDNKLLTTKDEKFSDVDTACLIIKNYNITDSGLYQCTLTNALGWSADCQYNLETANICLVKTPPMLPLCKKYKNIKLKARMQRKNENISMECLTVQWQKVKKEGEKEIVSTIHIDNAKYTLQCTQVDENTRTYELLIHQLTELDSGVYCCVLLDNACGKLKSEKLPVYVVEDFYNKEEWKNDDSIYEEPEEGFSTKIMTLLDQTDVHVVILVGPPGVGKTFTARHIALKMEGKGWDIYQIFNMEELLIEDNFPTSEQKLLIFDHPFGKTSVNIFNLVYFLLHKNIFHQLIRKTKVIMTCRSDIFEEIRAFHIDHLKNIIRMTKTYLGKSPRLLKEIFHVDKVQSGLSENDEASENYYLQRLCNQIGIYFNDGQNHMYDFYILILLAQHRNLILKQSLLCAQENVSQILENNLSKEKFTEGMKSAIKKSKYLRRKRMGDVTVCFCKHECIIDACICHMLKNDPQLFLKCAGNELICSHVCPFSASAGECWKLLDKEQYPILVKSLHEYLTSDDMCAMSDVIRLPYWMHDEFIDVFTNVLSQNEMTEILYGDKRYPIYIDNHRLVENSSKPNEQCDTIWNEIEMLRFELLFSGQWGDGIESQPNGFTVLSTNFVYWTISYGRYEAIDKILRLASNQNRLTDVNRCIMLACFRSVDIVENVLQHLKMTTLTDVRYSKLKTLFFDDQATILPLHVAIARENLDLVNDLLGKQVLINDVDHKKRSALLVAMEKNHKDITKTLLKIEGVDVNAHDIESRYPLHLAAMKGNEDFVKTLLDKKAKVDCVDGNDVTPLNTASTSGFKDITELLLKGGAKLNKFDNKEKSPLINALENEHIDVVGLLMQKLNTKSMDLNHRDVDGKTPLFVAVDKCYIETTKRLVKLGADVNIYDKFERTPLYLAADNNSFELVKYLIKKGSQSLVNKGDSNHKTPLHLAVEKSNLEMVEHLVKYGANVNSCDNDNKTPLLMAVEKFQNSEILEFLLKNGARADIDGNPGIQSPLFLAITMKNTEVFDILVKNKADLNKLDNEQRSVLCYAVERKEEKIVRILLHKRVEINTADTNKMTPLHYAAENNLYDILKLLVLEHADVNAADKNGRTPLHIASENGQLDIVEHLVRNGANVNKTDFEGDDPCEYAFKNQRKEIIMYLAKYGARLKTEQNYTRQNC
ncbi:uncharacterized protein LOC133188025 [Saccostrea echinata]|uniref:uncharacterized protein LOC133188025 n=1 Tax=Saccostrea echinata TaxID=191078 RepID=UPI002A81209E|nr:uncharacterized protein LOC133188025 [Saccostrea echinata]